MKSTLKYILSVGLLFGGATYVLRNIDFTTPDHFSNDEEVVTAQEVTPKKIIQRAPASKSETATELAPIKKQETPTEQGALAEFESAQDNNFQTGSSEAKYIIPASNSYSAAVSSTTLSNASAPSKNKTLPIAVAESKKVGSQLPSASPTPKSTTAPAAKTTATSVSSTTVTPTPTPTATPTPTPTATPTPTPTATPTPTPTATPTPTPTATPTPTPTVPATGIAVLSNTASGTYTYSRPFALTFYLDGTPAPADGNSIYCTTNTPGDPCCDPTDPANSGFTSVWTATVTLGNAGDGNYCVSFYGEHISTASTTAVTNLTFKIDSTSPAAPQVATETMVLQTTEKYNLRFSMNNDPLLSIGQSLSFYRLTPAELSSASNNCGNIIHDYLPLDLNGDGSPDTVDFVSYLMSYLDVLIYGSPSFPLALNYTETNYVISVTTKPNLDTPLNTCSITPIIVQDFEVFTDQPAYRVPASDASGSTLMGGFNPYSFFEGTETATGSSVGEGRYNELRSNFLNIIH